MARIYYKIAGGEVYGVHPAAPYPAVPAGIAFIDVPEAPHEIPWPVAPSGRSGEAYAKVAGGALVAFDRPRPAESAERQAIRALASALGKSPAVEAVLGKP